MKCRYAPVRTYTAVAALVIVLTTGACAMDPDDPTTGPADGSVRLQGRLSGLVRGAGVSAVPDGDSTVRALSSAAVNVAALPVVGGDLEVESAEVADVAEDGGFQVDVEPENDSEHVLLVNAPDEGVGVEEALGFLELPVSGEAAAGWALSESDESILELGDLSGTSGTFLADASPQDLLGVLNVDQQALLFQAQRDQYLKAVINNYLNRDFTQAFFHSNLINGTLAATPGEFSTPEAAYDESYVVLVELRFLESSDLDFAGIAAGDPAFEVVPPTEVVLADDGLTYSPEDPLQLTNVINVTLDTDNDGDTDTDGYEINFTVEGGFARDAGPWEVRVGDEKRATYDLDLINPFDADGTYLYFVPSLRIVTDGTPEQEVTGFELQWYAWDPEDGTYELADNRITGLFESLGTTMVVLYAGLDGAESEGQAFDATPNEVVPVDEGIYWNAGSGQRQLTAVEVDDGLKFGALWGFGVPGVQP